MRIILSPQKNTVENIRQLQKKDPFDYTIQRVFLLSIKTD